MVFLSLHSKSVKNLDSDCKIDRFSSFVPLLHISVRLSCCPENAIIYISTIHVHCIMFDNNYYNETTVCLGGQTRGGQKRGGWSYYVKENLALFILRSWNFKRLKTFRWRGEYHDVNSHKKDFLIIITSNFNSKLIL